MYVTDSIMGRRLHYTFPADASFTIHSLDQYPSENTYKEHYKTKQTFEKQDQAKLHDNKFKTNPFQYKHYTVVGNCWYVIEHYDYYTDALSVDFCRFLV
jgi:hypothetical protein